MFDERLIITLQSVSGSSLKGRRTFDAPKRYGPNFKLEPIAGDGDILASR